MQVGAHCPYSEQQIVALLPTHRDSELEATYLTKTTICQFTRSTGNKDYTALPLSAVTAITFSGHKPVWAMIAAVISGLNALAVGWQIFFDELERGTSDGDFMFWFLGISGFLCVIFLLIYCVYRRQRLVVSSPSGSIEVHLGGAKEDTVVNFIGDLHEAINAFGLRSNRSKNSS